jgi:hypothetical protein
MAINQLGDGSTDGVVIAPTGSKAAFYGAAPVAIRATNSQHVTSNVAAYSNTSASALIGTWITEVTNTLLGLGIWTSP